MAEKTFEVTLQADLIEKIGLAATNNNIERNTVIAHILRRYFNDELERTDGKPLDYTLRKSGGFFIPRIPMIG